MKKKFLIITGSRSEFGLIKTLVKRLTKLNSFDTKLIVTGSHLSHDQGNTYKEIEKEKIKIYKKIKINYFNKSKNITVTSVSEGLKNFYKLYLNFKPNLVIIPCDRYEMLGPALAAFFLNIPIAHLFGGETTYGSQDETIRHVLTKISTYHFVTHKSHKKRVLQMGESKKRVFLVGNMTIDNILSTNLFKVSQIKSKIRFSTNKKNILVTFHPITNIPKETERQFNSIISALKNIQNTNIIFTGPNHDEGHKIIRKMIKRFVSENNNAHFYSSLGHKLYFSVLKQIDCVLGNSSSALSEAPFLGATSINVGNRQKNRVQPGRVFNVKADAHKIEKKIKYVLKKEKNSKITDKAYLMKGATSKIIKVLNKLNFKNRVIKKFSDLKF